MKVRLQAIRKAKKMSRAELSYYSGVSQEAIYKLESGKTDFKKVQLETYLLLARALKVKVIAILPIDIIKDIK